MGQVVNYEVIARVEIEAAVRKEEIKLNGKILFVAIGMDIDLKGKRPNFLR